jgi:hypothetical protein
MRRSSLITTLIFAGALTMTGAPAFAQHGGGGHGGGGGHAGGGARSGGGVSRGGSPRGGGSVRMGGVGAPRAGSSVRGPYVGGNYFYRGGAAYRGGSYRSGGVYGSRYYGGGRYWGGRYWNVAPIHYYRPYYTFRPYFSLGFGLWSGYPVTWGYPYYYPYYSYPYAYPDPYPVTAGPGYTVAPPVDVTPYSTAPGTVGTGGAPLDQSNLGGMSFEITPSDAQIFVDGNPVGAVGQFTPTSQPLGVPSGRHHVEIRRDGYKTMSFDVDIVAGQVIPYQGQMER